MWENGLCRWRSLCPGAPVVKEVDLVTQFCFAMGIWVLGNFTLGMNLNEQKKQQVLTSHGGSSLAIDNFGSQSRGQNVTVTDFNFDFAAKKEQSPASTLGGLLKRLVFGLEEVLEGISRGN